MLTVYHSLTHLFSPAHFSFLALLHLEWQYQFLCNFPFLIWLLLLMQCPLIGPFIFRDLAYCYWLMDPGQVLCEGLILPCRSFRPLSCCCMVVALHLDNSTAKAYLCNQSCTVSPFFQASLLDIESD